MDLVSLILSDFSRLRLLVVGDLMIDRYITGSASRLSPEAPVPVLRKKGERSVLGGAANVAANITSLGAQCWLAGLIGDDEAGKTLLDLCGENAIHAEGVTVDASSPTTQKTRVLSGNQQLLRIDDEVTSPRSEATYASLIQSVEHLLDREGIDGIIVSDYAKGVTAPSLMADLLTLAQSRQIPVFIDPKGTDYQKYKGATAIKPNRKEMADFAQRHGWDEDPILAAKSLREAADLDYVALTLGEEGFVLVTADQTHPIPTLAQEVYDVTGAGDTVMAAFTLGVLAGLPPEEAAVVANHAAAIAISRVGSTRVWASELVSHLRDFELQSSAARKLYDLPTLAQLVEVWRSEGIKVVLTNGYFDLIHSGHTTLLREARAMGGKLVVAINSDDSIRRMKGGNRPFMNEHQRLAVLDALEPVDALVVFDQDKPREVLEALRPDVLVKGGDYKREAVYGHELVESYGGVVAIVPVEQDLNSAALADQLSRGQGKR